MPTSSEIFSAAIPVETDYAEMARRPLAAEQCALIVVDMQEKLLPPIWEKERLVKNVQLLIRLAGILKIPALLPLNTPRVSATPCPLSLPCCRIVRRSTN